MNKTGDILLKTHKFQHLSGTVSTKALFILPVMRDHLSWETTKFRSCFLQVSLYSRGKIAVKCTLTALLVTGTFNSDNTVSIPYIIFSSCAIDQSHRYGRHQAACREPAGSYDKTTRTAICFEHKTQYLFIRAPYTRLVVFWHISNIPPMISQSQITCNNPTFYIAAIFVKYICYTIGSWFL